MDIIIIGAGAAGLFAARELAKVNQKVIVLEARDRIGGRIHTQQLQNTAIEAGAEFIHGNLPITLEVFKEAGLKYEQIAGDSWQVKDGKWKKENQFLADEDLLIQKLKELKENISINEFLAREFGGQENEELREELVSYIEGYYSGDANRASALSFYQEFLTEDEQQYRPANGYGSMIKYLADDFIKLGGIVQTSTIVKEVRWSKGLVEVLDDSHHCYTARKVIITLPLGVLTAEAGDKGAVTFSPQIADKIDAAKRLGYGSAIKIVLQLKTNFWQNSEVTSSKVHDDVGFIFSDQYIGTWWTQMPKQSPLLTGWIAGPRSLTLKETTDHEIIKMAIKSLSAIFKVAEEFIEEQLVSAHAFNWTADPFTRGAYTYSTTETNEARKVLAEPIANSIYFAGEALYDGPEIGTVEAALTSGKEVAEKVLSVQELKGGNIFKN